MKIARYLVISSILLTTACGSAQLNQGTIARGVSSPAKGESSDQSSAVTPPAEIPAVTEQPAAPPTNAPSLPPEVVQEPTPEAPVHAASVAQMPPPNISIPISIGGASLTCNLKDDRHAECLAKSENGKALTFTPKKAYFIDQISSKWQSVNFIKLQAIDLYLVDLPYAIKNQSFAVALTNSEEKMMYDWVVSPADPIKTSVKNGGFEDVKFTGSADYSTQFIDATNVTSSSWQVKSKDPTCHNILEISTKSLDSRVTPIEGSQWTELDSSCFADRVEDKRYGNNIKLYQDIAVKAGDLYELSFAYKYRVGVNNQQKFVVRFEGSDLVSFEVKDGPWKDAKILVRAKSALGRLEFEEFGNDTDGEGTLLDNVRLTPFGSGPPSP